MKVVILGDTHCGVKKSDESFHNYFSKFFSFMFDYMNENEINTIIQEGDLFDIRKEVQFTTLHRANEYFFDKLKEYSMTMYCIVGNHDCTYKSSNEVNSVRLLKTDEMVVVDKTPSTLFLDGVGIDLYPWINQANLDDSMAFCEASTSKFGVGHFEFKNFPLHPGSIAESGMDHSSFSRYTQIFSGHYHTISKKDNILYTGTPYELDWSDWEDPKGFWVLDLVTEKYEFIRNPYTIFCKIFYSDDLEYDFTQAKDKIIKLIVTGTVNKKKYDSFLHNLSMYGPISVKIIEEKISESVLTAVKNSGNIESLSTKEVIYSVLDSLTFDSIDMGILKTKIGETYTEASNITRTL